MLSYTGCHREQGDKCQPYACTVMELTRSNDRPGTGRRWSVRPVATGDRVLSRGTPGHPFMFTPTTGRDMTDHVESRRSTTLSPDEAFSALGDEARLDILKTLGEADGPLTHSELFDRVEYDDASNFDYHLRKVVGHFVRKTDRGYDLRDAGRRVVEAVLSGAITDTPVVEPTRVDRRCPFCAAPIEVGFQDARVELSCTECSGYQRFAGSGGRRFTEYGTLGFFYFPPAGLRGRSAAEVLDAAWTWRHVDFLADSSGVCSRCSAALDHSVTVCEDHDSTEGNCDRCGRRNAVLFEGHCTNCNYEFDAIAPGCLLSTTELLAFLTAHGINPVAPDTLDAALETLGGYDEEVVSTDPFEARFTFAVDKDALTLTVDDALEVVDVRRHGVADGGG